MMDDPDTLREKQSELHEEHRRHRITLFSCKQCCYENTEMAIKLINDIRELETHRDGLGRHTTLSAEMESLMSRHEKLFNLLS